MHVPWRLQWAGPSAVSEQLAMQLATAGADPLSEHGWVSGDVGAFLNPFFNIMMAPVDAVIVCMLLCQYVE